VRWKNWNKIWTVVLSALVKNHTTSLMNPLGVRRGPKCMVMSVKGLICLVFCS
jgi:hypothetical protein